MARVERLVLAERDGLDAASRDALRLQVRRHGLRAAIAQRASTGASSPGSSAPWNQSDAAARSPATRAFSPR